MSRIEQLSLASQAVWFFGFAERHPHLYDAEELTHYWSRCLEQPEPERARWLRAALLRKARIACGSCTDCGLSRNRLAGRPVFDDGSAFANRFGDHNVPIGAAGAEIMLVGEGPGSYEARTGQPFVSPLVLAGSLCARRCDGYERCYPEGSQTPQAPCQPVRMEGSDAAIREMRAYRASNLPKTFTAGSLLDKALIEVELWREGWNDRQSLVATRPGTAPHAGSVYIANVVKCRACKESADAAGGFIDTPPASEEVDACRRWLDVQIEILQPKVIVALGATAIKALLNLSEVKVGELCGQVRTGPHGIPIVACFHPSHPLRRREQNLTGETMVQIVAAFRTAVRIAGEPEIIVEPVREIPEPVGAPRPSAARFIPTIPVG